MTKSRWSFGHHHSQYANSEHEPKHGKHSVTVVLVTLDVAVINFFLRAMYCTIPNRRHRRGVSSGRMVSVGSCVLLVEAGVFLVLVSGMGLVTWIHTQYAP